ncbi:MAG TPA: hypothetical protein VKR30_01785 [Candidatus Limnocylindrales bacterium]|nr:hypothetical protein [Candidatus Limnocylindrales bacterium]
MTDPRATVAGHAAHDLTVLAAAADRDADDATRLSATAQMADCPECRALFADLTAISAGLADLPRSLPVSRDFRLSPERAARLRSPGWRERLAGLARSPSLRPMATAFTALGLAGLLLSAAASGVFSIPLGASGAAAPALAPAASPAAADNFSGGSGSGAGSATGSGTENQAATAPPPPGAGSTAGPAAAATPVPVGTTVGKGAEPTPPTDRSSQGSPGGSFIPPGPGGGSGSGAGGPVAAPGESLTGQPGHDGGAGIPAVGISPAQLGLWISAGLLLVGLAMFLLLRYRSRSFGR